MCALILCNQLLTSVSCQMMYNLILHAERSDIEGLPTSNAISLQILKSLVHLADTRKARKPWETGLQFFQPILKIVVALKYASTTLCSFCIQMCPSSAAGSVATTAGKFIDGACAGPILGPSKFCSIVNVLTGTPGCKRMASSVCHTSAMQVHISAASSLLLAQSTAEQGSRRSIAMVCLAHLNAAGLASICSRCPVPSNHCRRSCLALQGTHSSLVQGILTSPLRARVCICSASWGTGQ